MPDAIATLLLSLRLQPTQAHTDTVTAWLESEGYITVPVVAEADAHVATEPAPAVAVDAATVAPAVDPVTGQPAV